MHKLLKYFLSRSEARLDLVYVIADLVPMLVPMLFLQLSHPLGKRVVINLKLFPRGRQASPYRIGPFCLHQCFEGLITHSIPLLLQLALNHSMQVYWGVYLTSCLPKD